MSRIRVHVVDDDRDAVDLLRGYLAHADCDLDASHSGQDALDRLQVVLPELVLLDVQMPDLDGFEVLAAMRQDARLRQVPVIFLSSFDRPNLKVRALEMGADDYVVKPFHPAELVARVRAVLRRRAGPEAVADNFAGDLARFPLATLLQSLAIAEHDALVCFPERRLGLRLASPRDPSLALLGLWAWIALGKGRFLDACLGVTRGKEALARLLLCSSGRFETRFDERLPLTSGCAPVAVEGLLLGLMVTLDEVRDTLAAVGDLDVPLRPTAAASQVVRDWFGADPESTPRHLLVRSLLPFSETAVRLVDAYARGEVVVEVPSR